MSRGSGYLLSRRGGGGRVGNYAHADADGYLRSRGGGGGRVANYAHAEEGGYLRSRRGGRVLTFTRRRVLLLIDGDHDGFIALRRTVIARVIVTVT